MDNLEQKKLKKRKNNGELKLIYKLTHYRSYYDYKIKLAIIRYLVRMANTLGPICRAFQYQLNSSN